MKIRVPAIVLLLLLSACEKGDIYLQFHSFAGAEWNKEEAATFEVPIHDNTTPYHVTIHLRNNNRYPYRNLWLFVDYQTPNGQRRTDTLSVDLADAYGKWYGTGISLYNHSLPYQTGVQYADTGTHTYTLRHGMRADVLRGIADIGVRVRRE
jgi:gliding motility-associated lipoprotein GldH